MPLYGINTKHIYQSFSVPEKLSVSVFLIIAESDVAVEVDKTVYQKILTFLFGHTDVHQVEEFLVEKRRKFLLQGKKATTLLNINAVFLMLVIAFLTGFFN